MAAVPPINEVAMILATINGMLTGAVAIMMLAKTPTAMSDTPYMEAFKPSHC